MSTGCGVEVGVGVGTWVEVGTGVGAGVRVGVGVEVGVAVRVGREVAVGVMGGTDVAVEGASFLSTISGVAVGVSVGRGGDAVGTAVTSKSGAGIGVGA